MEEDRLMARVRPARRCRARSKRTGLPCGAFAVVGAVVCRMHGAAASRVRVAAAQRLERLALERAMVHAEQLLAVRIEAWIAERREVAGELLGKPAEEVTPEDVRHCSLVYGRPDPYDPGPQLRLDRRFGPRRRSVVIRRRR
jgi:hypothetical protein